MVPTAAKSGARHKWWNALPKTGATHFHAQSTLTDKDRVNKRLVI